MSTPDKSPNPNGGKQGNGNPTPEMIAAGKMSLYFAVLILGAILTSELNLPWKVSALVFGAAALVAGIIAMVRAVKAKMRGSIFGFLSLGLVLTVIVTLTQVWAIALWPWQSNYETCLDNAITDQAHHKCITDYEDHLNTLIPGELLGPD